MTIAAHMATSLQLLVSLASLVACAPDTAKDTATSRDTAATSDTAEVDDTAVMEDTGADSSDSGDTSDTAQDGPELWVYASFNLQTDAGRDGALALMERAAAAGYRGLVLTDFKFHLLQTDLLASWYRDNLRAVQDRAEALGLRIVPAILPFGYSEGILYAQPDLAEARPVVATFVAWDGELVHEPAYDGPTDPGFESHSGATLTGWDWQDERVVADTSVAHGGGASARMDAGAGNARVARRVAIFPRHQYHLSWWMKTEGFSGFAQVTVLDAATSRPLTYFPLRPAATQDWTRYDMVFDSGDLRDVRLYAGVWGEMTGTAWFDDVRLTETALVNLVRREGAPLVVQGPDCPSIEEGVDVAPIVDTQVQEHGFDDWHAPPVPQLLPGSRIAQGSRVEITHYVVQRVEGYQVGACLSDPAVDAWVDDNLTALAEVFPSSEGFLLGYDEMRHMNSCEACAARGLDAGELLAEHASTTIAEVEARWPGSRAWVWSDMFDPFHNAHDDYYMVEGDVSGSWEGLPASTVVLNWNLGNAESLGFFDARGNAQIVAGYYDEGDGTAAAVRDLAPTGGLSGVRGAMYTTWRGDYDQLETYADAVRAAWGR